MKRTWTITIYTLFFAWLSIAWMPVGYVTPTSKRLVAIINPVIDPLSFESSTLYELLSLESLGLSKQAFTYAYKGYRKLIDKKKIDEGAFLAICDFSQSSKNKRFYLVDMENKEVVLQTFVAHGRNSGKEYATRFSNRARSLQSSLGFYVTDNTYYGEHGLSLRIKGMEPGFNDKALQRNIVVHGANYLEEEWVDRNKGMMGRSFGCPAVPKKESETIINKIKNGNCLFIYHPSKNYLKGSKILNG